MIFCMTPQFSWKRGDVIIRKAIDPKTFLCIYCFLAFFM